MSKALASWSAMRKYLEQEMLASELQGRIRYGCTTYVGMDDCKIFDISIDGKQLKRFSWETVNTYFIENGLKESSEYFGSIGYWIGFHMTLSKVPMSERTEYTDEEFCEALTTYRNGSIKDSINSENPIVRMFAILDRRTGKRTLEAVKESLENQPEWLRLIYQLRFEASLQ